MEDRLKRWSLTERPDELLQVVNLRGTPQRDLKESARNLKRVRTANDKVGRAVDDTHGICRDDLENCAGADVAICLVDHWHMSTVDPLVI